MVNMIIIQHPGLVNEQDEKGKGPPPVFGEDVPWQSFEQPLVSGSESDMKLNSVPVNPCSSFGLYATLCLPIPGETWLEGLARYADWSAARNTRCKDIVGRKR